MMLLHQILRNYQEETSPNGQGTRKIMALTTSSILINNKSRFITYVITIPSQVEQFHENTESIHAL